MPIIGTYQSKIMPPATRETVPSNMANIAAAPAEAVAGLGGAMAKFGMDVLNRISEAQDATDTSNAERQIHENWNTEFAALQTTQDPEARKQLHTKAAVDRVAIISAIKRPNVRNLMQNKLNSYEPQFDTHFNNLDNKMKIDAMGDALDNNVASGIADNDYPRVEKAVGLAIHTGVVSKDKAELILRKAKNDIDNQTVFSLAIRAGDKEAGYEVIDSSGLSDEDKAILGNRLDNYWAGRVKQEQDNRYANTIKFYNDSAKKLMTGTLTSDEVELSTLDKEDKEKWQGYIQGSFAVAPPKTTPDGYDEISNTVMQFSQGQLSKQQAYDNILTTRYTTGGITDNDFKWAIGKLEHPYPKHIVSDLKSTMAANRQQIAGWWETTANRERSLRLNLDLLGWIDNEIANKKTPTAKEMYQRSAELMAGQKTIEQTQARPNELRLQSAPDIALDPYWKDMTDEEKNTAWVYIQKGGDVNDIIKLLQK